MLHCTLLAADSACNISLVSLALYIGKGGPAENTNGFEIDFINDIRAFNFKPIAIFQGGGL